MVYKSSDEVTEVFNSLGTEKKFLTESLEFKTFYEYNITAVQKSDSIQCGQFCIFFIVNRLFNLDVEFEDLINELFVADLEKNEQIVKDFIQECII